MYPSEGDVFFTPRVHRKHGVGTLFYADGTVYEGEFADDAIDGVGKITFAKGTAIEEARHFDYNMSSVLQIYY